MIEKRFKLFQYVTMRLGLKHLRFWLIIGLLPLVLGSCGFLEIDLKDSTAVISPSLTDPNDIFPTPTPTQTVTPKPHYYFSRTLGSSTAKLVYFKSNEFGEAFAFGYFTGAVDFSFGGTTPDLRTSIGGADAFLTKFNSEGNPLWTRTFGGTGQDLLMGLTFTKTNEVVATGRFSSSVNFDTTNTQPQILTSRGFNESFILKLSSEGHTKWVKTIGKTNSRSIATDVAEDSKGYLHVTGSYCGQSDFDPGEEAYLLKPPGYPDCDAFYLKLTQQGDFLAAQTIGGTSYDWGLSLLVDLADNVFLSFGNLYNTFNFQSYTATNAGNGDNGFVSLNSNGQFRFGNLIGTSGWDGGGQIRVDNEGNLYLLSLPTNKSEVEFNKTGQGSSDKKTIIGSYAIALTKISMSGHYLWTKIIDPLSSTGSVAGGYGADLDYAPVTIQAFSVTPDNRLFLTGNLSGTASFPMNNTDPSLPQEVTGPVRFVLEINSNTGDFVRLKTFEIPAGIRYSSGLTLGQKSDLGQDLYIFGMFRGTDLDLNVSGAEGANADRFSSQSSTADDFFFTKIRWE